MPTIPAQRLGAALSPVITGRRADEYRALDTPYNRLPRFSPRRYIRNCNPAFPSMNKANAVWMQAENWGMDWGN